MFMDACERNNELVLVGEAAFCHFLIDVSAIAFSNEFPSCLLVLPTKKNNMNFLVVSI